MITIDTITDEQIRELLATAKSAKWKATVYVCKLALDEGATHQPAARIRKARGRCAEILSRGLEVSTAKAKRGRPARAGQAAEERIEIRLTKLERAAWEHAAAKHGVSVSEWIRGACFTVLKATGIT